LGSFWFVHCDGNWIFVCGTCVTTPAYVSSSKRPALFLRLWKQES
jgi:hypothetical protein